MNIIDEFHKTKTDYGNTTVVGAGRFMDRVVYISVIIPVHERTEFTKIVSHFLLNSINHSPWEISVTFVEHDEKSRHGELIPDWANYIFIPKNGDKFNKCLCHNIGVLCGPKAEFYNFHDIDTIMGTDYFLNIMLNMKGKNALQTFTKRRLLLANEALTKRILNSFETMRSLPSFSPDLRPAQAGAAGGSMFVSRNLFFDVGGFDPYYTEYSIEDQAMWDTLDLMGKLGTCDQPPNELIHLSHPPSFWRKTKQTDWDYYHGFKFADEETKKEFIKVRSEHLRSFI